MAELVLKTVADAAAALDHATSAIRAGEVAQCLAIARLCDLHEVDETVLVEGCERWVPGGADGTPLIGEFVTAHISTLLGAGIGSAFRSINRVLNLRHRHPTLWRLVIEGDIRPFEGFLVADAAVAAKLDVAACARFDRLCATALSLQPWGRVKGQVEKWLLAADPEQALANAEAANRRRDVTLGRIKDGHVGLWGQLDAADGLALDEALTLLAGDVEGESIDERRATALGLLARQALGQSPLPEPGEGTRPRKVDLIIRLDHTGIATITGWGHVLLSQLPSILHGCTVRVRPIVIGTDLPPVDGYQVPDTMRAVLNERNPVDVFPYGTRPADTCQADHTIPYTAGVDGQTHLGNLGPLSSFTHRLKTHGGWRLEQPSPGHYRWRSPLGYEYAVTAEGTVLINRPPPAEHAWWRVEPPDYSDPDDITPPDGATRAGARPDPGPRQQPLPYVA